MKKIKTKLAQGVLNKKKNMQRKSASFIVGIGGSAGALGVFEKFFQHLPDDTGMAFVLVPHLDPTRKGLMPELLQNYTKMKVEQVNDGINVEPNHVYVIAPNRDLAILNGRLQLLEPQAPRGLRLPIDFFLRSLAEDQGEKAACIILSGMGSDGTLGLKAIKDKLGLVLVQDPTTTEFNSMPNSAIATGLVDYILPAEDLAKKLIDYVKFPVKLKPRPILATTTAATALQKIFLLLRTQIGHDFSYYKHSTIFRRLERRMNIHQIKDIRKYVRYLQQNPSEIEALFKELLIGVTGFFRDPAAFEILKAKVIPQLLKARPGEGQIRIWVIGCSSGEEAYSMAIIVQEALKSFRPKQKLKIQIFATDIDPRALEKARAGVYPANIVADVSPKRLAQFFDKHDNDYSVKREIREMVVFALHNVIKDPPFTKLDILCCRNLLIYMVPELQKKLIPVFCYSLNPAGILFLGPAESIGGFEQMFLSLNNRWKIFRRKETASVYPEIPGQAMDFLRQAGKREPVIAKIAADERIAIPEIAQKVLLEDYAPAFVVIDPKGSILYFGSKTGKYLEPAVGEASTNIISMAREGLGFAIDNALRQAVSQKKTVTVKDLKVKTNGTYQMINLLVRPFQKPERMQGLFMVVFEDAGPLKRLEEQEIKKGLAPPKYALVKELQKELNYTKERLQTTTEEMESSLEELKSANEELQSTNEELQSSNEELMTSKEEMQSLNEELATVNSELETKVNELDKVNNDMKNLYGAAEIATVFLDNNLCIKGFTPQATKITNFIKTDVGRPIIQIVSNLKYENLTKEIAEVIDTLVSKEVQVQTQDGRWYMMRILPYRTLDNAIDGAVLTFSDITTNVKLEEELDGLRLYAENIINTVREPLIVLGTDLKVISASRSFYSTFNVSPEETMGKMFYDLGNRQWDIPELRKLLEEILPKNEEFNDYAVEHDFPEIGRKKLLLNARRLFSEGKKSELILLAIEEGTGR